MKCASIWQEEWPFCFDDRQSVKRWKSITNSLWTLFLFEWKMAKDIKLSSNDYRIFLALHLSLSFSLSPESRDANRFRLFVLFLTVIPHERTHRYCCCFSFSPSSLFVCDSRSLPSPPEIKVKEWDNAVGHHVPSPVSLSLSTQFPDDDYPCCELVTSFTRGRNIDR